MNIVHNALSRYCRQYALRYESLHKSGQGLAFPCDERGSIDLDAMPERARNNYFAARALVGREYAHPIVEEIAHAA